MRRYNAGPLPGLFAVAAAGAAAASPRPRGCAGAGARPGLARRARAASPAGPRAGPARPLRRRRRRRRRRRHAETPGGPGPGRASPRSWLPGVRCRRRPAQPVGHRLVSGHELRPVRRSAAVGRCCRILGPAGCRSAAAAPGSAAAECAPPGPPRQRLGSDHWRAAPHSAAQRRAAPRSAAQRRAAQRSAAQRRAAPRTHARWVAQLALPGQSDGGVPLRTSQSHCLTVTVLVAASEGRRGPRG